MNNYPPGAANDPNAPYNQSDPPEVDVTVTEKLVKETCIQSDGGHYVDECDYDPAEGRSIRTSYYEPGDLSEDFRNQCRTASQCIADCCEVLRELIKHGFTFSSKGDLYLRQLLSDCEDWEQEKLEIEET